MLELKYVGHTILNEHLLQFRVARPKILNVKFGHKDFKEAKNPQNLMIDKFVN